MDLRLQIGLISVCLVFLVIVISMLRRDKLNLKYSLVWIFTCSIMLLISIFPKIAFAVSSLIGIVAPVNAVFLFAIIFILIILFTFTVIITRISARVRKLTQDIALLEEKQRNMANRS